jgi:hypothetical protein
MLPKLYIPELESATNKTSTQRTTSRQIFFNGDTTLDGRVPAMGYSLITLLLGIAAIPTAAKEISHVSDRRSHASC